MSGAAWRIVTLAALDDPERLGALAESIFGRRDRPPAWFARKLRRERVVPAYSPVAITADGDPDDPATWLGYMLVGTPDSLGDAARSAGTGVRPQARGRGIASALLDAATAAAARAGKRRLQLLAEPDLVRFYTDRQFAAVQDVVTLVRPSRGDPAVLLPRGAAWDALDAPQSAPLHTRWLPEAWAGTEPALRHTLRDPAVAAHVSREGRAWVVHRLHGPADPVRTASALLHRLPAGHPVVLPLLPRGPSTDRLIAAGWFVAQRATLLARPTAAIDR